MPSVRPLTRAGDVAEPPSARSRIGAMRTGNTAVSTVPIALATSRSTTAGQCGAR